MKFWAIIIASDLTIKRMWMDSQTATSLLKEHKNIKIYNAAHSQEAVLSGESLLWRDVLEVDKYEVES